MTGVAANDKHHPAAADNLAMIANPFNAGTYFHDSSPFNSYFVETINNRFVDQL
jgi:hypothetical protein